MAKERAIEKAAKAAKIRSLMKAWDDYFDKNNKKFYKWQEFVVGNQWNDKENSTMSTRGKIPLVFNVINPLSNNVAAEQRLTTPNISIEASDNTPVEVANVRGALIKDIAFESNAKTIYQNAFKSALDCGYGAWIVSTRYMNERSFEQEIFIDMIEQPTLCYWDIGAKRPEKIDGMFCGYRVHMTRRKFISLWGKNVAEKIGYTDYETNNKRVKNPDQSENTSQSKKIKEMEGGDVLTNEKFITVIYHFEKQSDLSTLYEMSDGTCLSQKELDDLEEYEELDEAGNVIEAQDEDQDKVYILNDSLVTVERERSIEDDYKIVHSVWAGDYELEKSDLACKRLPMPFVDQNSYINKEGKQVTTSFFEHAKDPQRLLNYAKSQQAYIMMSSRYDQFMGTPDMTATPESQEIWSNPLNVQGMLTFDKPKGTDGLQAPIQVQPPAFPQALMQIDESCMVYIQHTTGLYDTQMGNQGDVVSGVASNHQSRKGAKNTFIARDNLNRAIAVTAEIIDEMIPIIYDTTRTVKLHLPDKGMKSVMLNQPVDEYGNLKNDMSQGEYKIKLVVGPSTEDEKADNIQAWELLLAAAPQANPNMMDLVAKALPLEDVIEVSNRYRAMADPKIIDAGKSGEPLQPQQPQPDPNMLMVQLEQQKLQMQQQKNQADYQIKIQELELKKGDLQLKAIQTHQDMSLEFEKIDALKREAEAKMIEQEQRTQAEFARVQADIDISHHQNIKEIVTAGMHSKPEYRSNLNNERQ